jgi:two-component system, cell cycle sensor histidine kinase and response regulator CckA
MPVPSRPRPKPNTRTPGPNVGFEEFLRNLDAIVWEADAGTFQFTYVSPAAYRITGHPITSWCTTDFWASHIHPDDRERAVGFCMTATREGRDHEFEYRFLAADGRVLWLRDIVHVVVGDAKKPVGLRGLMIDITRQKQAEAALEESTNRFHDLLVNLEVGIMVLGSQTETLLHNPAACELLGLTDNELLGRDLYDPRWNVIHEDGSPFPPSSFPVVRALATGRPVRNAVMGVYRPRSGDRVWLLVNATPQLDPEGRVRQVVASFGDITMARDLQAQLRLLQKAVSRLNDVVLITETEPLDDPGPRILYVNEAFERVTGYPRGETVGRPIYSLFGPQTDRDVVARMVEDIRASRPATGEIALPRYGGGEYRVACSAVSMADERGEPANLVIIARDVTERRRLEEQLRHSQKLEAVGMLAGGVAHDFNNLLTAIIGYSELLLGKIEPGETHWREVEEIRRAAERAASLTRQLLAFSRKQVLNPRVISVNGLAANLGEMLRRLLGEAIELETVLDPDPGWVKVDPVQLEQAIINLAVNARDAMSGGGTLRIATERIDVDAEYARLHPGVTPGPHVLLRVEDTGMGMDAATQAHIFDPFFTTKDVGRGTGLGLATVYGIVNQSGGAIWVESEPGGGSRFRILLPRSDTGPSDEPGSAPSPARRMGSETILLAEDEPSVRVLAREVLRDAGYTVIEASEGEEALRASAAHEGTIHLLVTDVVMPRMQGRALADALRAARPGVQVLYISGYPDKLAAHHAAPDPCASFLEKPFSPNRLLGCVRQALDGPRASA